MKTANQLTFTTYETSLKLKSNDPTKVIFDHIDWSFIHPLVKDKYSALPQGADGYDPISMFKAQLLIYLGEGNSDRKLAEALRYNGRLCLLCGFNFLKTPSNGSFTNFRDRLGENTFYEILHQLIAQAIVLKVIQGGDTAIDSTHIWAYASKFGYKTCRCKGKCSCPKSYSDTDAQWGAKSKDYLFFGYKVHLIVDSKSQLPLEVKVTPGNKADSPQAIPLLKGAKKKHPDNQIDTSAMDSAYDSRKNYRFAIKEAKIAPIIALNPRNGVDAITSNSLTLSRGGGYTCMAGFKVIYWGKEEKRGRLKFRCPAVVGKCKCIFRSVCSQSQYGRTFYLNPERDYRLIGTIPRGTTLWQNKYDKRTSIERAYSEEKGSHKLADPRVRGLAKVKIHVYLALCAQVIKRIGTAIMEKLIISESVPCPIRI
jgi:transposase